MSSQASTLDVLLHTLAVSGERTAVSRDHRLFRKSKHTKLLSHISIILVTEAKGDVAAVTLQTRQDAAIGKVAQIFFTKNRPCNQAETRYVHDLISALRSAHGGANTKACSMRIARLVYSNCIKKIESRFSRLNQAFKEAFYADYVEPWGQPPANTVVGGDFPHEDFAALHEILSVSFWLGNDSRLVQTLRNAKLQRRVKKLGAYYAAIGTLVREAKKPGPFDDFEAHEIVNEPDRFVGSDGTPLQVLNSLGAQWIGGFDEILPGQVQYFLPQAYLDLIHVEPPKIRLVAHCECTLAATFATRLTGPSGSRLPTTLEICVSKHCCWPCLLFLEGLAKAAHIDIRITGCHGKTYRGWSFPSNVPHSNNIQAQLESILEDRLIKTLTEIPDRRRSDSAPNDSPEEDIDHFSWSEDSEDEQ